MRSVFAPVQPEGFGIVRRLEMDGEKKKKKRFMAEMRWNAGWGLERKKEEEKNVKNCCWLLDENEDICVDLEGYIDTEALRSPSAPQQSLSRENPGFTQLVTLLILFLSPIHDCLPHPPCSQCGTYICSASSLTERKCNRSKQISFRLLKWKWVLLFEWKRNAFFSSQIALSVTCRALVCLP